MRAAIFLHFSSLHLTWCTHTSSICLVVMLHGCNVVARVQHYFFRLTNNTHSEIAKSADGVVSFVPAHVLLILDE